MAVQISYDVKGYNRVRNALRKMASEHGDTIDKTVKGFAQNQRARLKSYGYPSQRLAPQPFKTDKQRRWFFWALDAGLINVPYIRTGRLANSWRAEQKGKGEWAIANSAEYASWVVGRGAQSHYHKNHWWIAQDIIDEEVGKLTEDLTHELLELADEMEGAI